MGATKDPRAIARGRARQSAMSDHERRDFAASGGRASAAKLTAEERTERAKWAARARWGRRMK